MSKEIKVAKRKDEPKKKPSEDKVNELKQYLDNIMNNSRSDDLGATDAINAIAIMNTYIKEIPCGIPYEQRHLDKMRGMSPLVEEFFRKTCDNKYEAVRRSNNYWYSLLDLFQKLHDISEYKYSYEI